MIQRQVQASDGQRADSVAIRSRLASPRVLPVIAELTRDAGEGSGGYARRQRTGVYRAIRMPVYDWFTADRSVSRPAAYLLPSRFSRLAALLRRHDIAVEQTTVPWRTGLQLFTVERVQADSLFEGHRPVLVEGRWQPGSADSLVPKGVFLVRTDQPLGTLAVYLLEPESEDGFVTWNLLDGELRAGSRYPIARVESTATVPLTAVP